jgi:hypothetical protein
VALTVAISGCPCQVIAPNSTFRSHYLLTHPPPGASPASLPPTAAQVPTPPCPHGAHNSLPAHSDSPSWLLAWPLLEQTTFCSSAEGFACRR